MFGTIPYKTKQFFFVLIKLSIVVGAFYFIYHKLTNNQELDFVSFIDFLSKNNHFTPKNIFFLILLSNLNWFFEILKWQKLVSIIKKISFFHALEQCLGSLTASLFTPNRVGEYGAKAMYYNRRVTKKILALNLLSNGLQMSVTVIAGIIGCFFYFTTYSLNIEYYKLFRILIIFLIVVLFPIIGLRSTKFSIRGISFSTAKAFFTKVPWTIYLTGFMFSILRYVIFSFQFYFLLNLFGLNMGYGDALVIITTMYFLASIVPTIALFDVVLKGGVAVFLFAATNFSSMNVLIVVMLMWILNVVFPSLIGAFYVLKFKIPKHEL